MNRLNDKQKSEIRQLSRILSLNKISKQMKLPKSVVYYWYRKNVGKKIKPIIVNERLDEKLGELIGIFSSDGTFIKEKKYSYKIRIFLSKNEYEYSTQIRKLFEEVFGKSGSIFEEKNKHMIFIQIFGKEIIETFQKYIDWEYGKKTYTVKLKKQVKNYKKYFLIGFLRGLFMGDGWISTKSTGFGSTSFGLIKDFTNILEFFKIKYYLHSYDKQNKKRFHMITIPVSEKQKFLNIFKIKKMLPAGISG